MDLIKAKETFLACYALWTPEERAKLNVTEALRAFGWRYPEAPCVAKKCCPLGTPMLGTTTCCAEITDQYTAAGITPSDFYVAWDTGEISVEELQRWIDEYNESRG